MHVQLFEMESLDEDPERSRNPELCEEALKSVRFGPAQTTFSDSVS